jgi:hypothetical protein
VPSDGSGPVERLRIDSSGNLGLGVTPSAWSGFGKTMEFNNAGCYVGNSGATSMQVGANNYFNGSNYIYSTSNVATRYAQSSGQHLWFTSSDSTPTAGNTISFTQAMTLDASGNLLIGGTTTPSGGKANNFVNLGGSGGFWTKSGGVGYFGTFDNYAMVFATNDTERARITSAGRFGIGTTSPGEFLTVKSGNGDQVSLDNAGERFTQITYKNNGTNKGAIWVDNTNSLFELYGFSGIGMTFYTNAAERARITSGGNFLIGTTVDIQQVSIKRNTSIGWVNAAGNGSDQIIYADGSSNLQFYTNATERARITASGNFGIGTTDPDYGSFGATERILGITGVSGNRGRLSLQNTSTGTTGVTGTIAFFNGSTQLASFEVLADGATNRGYYAFNTNDGTSNSERARITSGGYSKFSNDGTYAGSTGSYHEFVNSASDDVIRVRNKASLSPLGIDNSFSAAAPNNTANYFFQCRDTGGERATIRSNGGLANYQGNDVNLSDRREKTNFAPAKSYLDTICAIPVQTFNYIDQSENDPGLTLGVVAQDVQAVAPELVMESDWSAEKDGSKMRLSIYQTDLQYALMKCIQELKAQNDDLRARVAQLEAK